MFACESSGQSSLGCTYTYNVVLGVCIRLLVSLKILCIYMCVSALYVFVCEFSVKSSLCYSGMYMYYVWCHTTFSNWLEDSVCVCVCVCVCECLCAQNWHNAA